jgi:hypothetical protein
MGNSSTQGLIIQLENASCFNGQELHGIIHLILESPLSDSTLFLSFIGLEETYWEETRIKTSEKANGDKTVSHRGRKQICNFRYPLFSFDRGLLPGGYSFPFSLVLPTNIPGTFAYSLGTTHASITYRLHASLDCHGSKPIVGDCPVKIRQAALGCNTNLNQYKCAKMKTWCCKDQGLCKINVSYPQDAYHPSQVASFYAEIDNSLSKLCVNSVFCRFQYKIRLRSNGGATEFIRRNVIVEEIPVKIAPGANLLNDLGVEIKLNLPARRQLLENMYSTKGALIECMYTNVVGAQMDGTCMCCGDKPSVESVMYIVPNMIIVPTAPPQPPPDWNPQVYSEVRCQYDGKYEEEPTASNASELKFELGQGNS